MQSQARVVTPTNADTGNGLLDALLTPQQAAAYTGLAIATLQRQRSEGSGPRFVKLGRRRVGYRLADVRAWLDSRVASSTADARVRVLAR